MPENRAFKYMIIFLTIYALLSCAQAQLSDRAVTAAEEIPFEKVIPVPDSIRERFKLESFYQKFISAKGLPILSSASVADEALLRANELTNKLLAGRQDIRQAMIADGVRLTVIGAKEETTDIPEYRNMSNKEYVNERARGFGGRMTSFGEENLLCLPIDRYDDENIMIHEFGGHCIHRILRRLDKDFDTKLRTLYDDAISKGLYKYTYAGNNISEYWAESVQSYFDTNRQNNWNHNHVNTREELYAYDPNMAKFVADTFRLTAELDWRYKPLAKQPLVTTPPAKLNCDPFYKKYLNCRSLAILGSEKASDEAMYVANDTIRNMFTFRHDILKPMIDDGLRVIILAEGQSSKDVPECKTINQTSRYALFLKPQPRLVVGQEFILSPEKEGENPLVKEFARAVVAIVAQRPVEPNFEKRRDKQQYELYGVERVDTRFNEKLQKLYNQAMEKGLWKNTLAAKDHVEYFAEGVQSWFECNKESFDGRADGQHNHVNIRSELKQYDPNLAAFIEDTFKHTQRSLDWRCPLADSQEQNLASDYLQKLSLKTKQLESYQCGIEYLLKQPLFESQTLRKGVLYYQKLNDKSQLRVNFLTLKQDDEKEQKYVEHFIFDGIWLTRIDYQIEKVERRQLAEPNKPEDPFDLASRNLPIIGFTKIEDLQKQFEIKLVQQEKAEAERSFHLHLKVKPDSIYKDDYTAIDFWIDKKLGLPAKVVAVSTEEDIHEIKFLKPNVNEKIDKKVFEFEIPKGFTVEEIPLKKKGK